jgi:hypothetical protein
VLGDWGLIGASNNRLWHQFWSWEKWVLLLVVQLWGGCSSSVDAITALHPQLLCREDELGVGAFQRTASSACHIQGTPLQCSLTVWAISSCCIQPWGLGCLALKLYL